MAQLVGYEKAYEKADNMTRILIDARLGWGSGIGRYVANTVPLVAALLPTVVFDIMVARDDIDKAGALLSEASNIRVVPVDIEPFSLSEQLRFSALAKNYDLTWFTNYWVPLNFRHPFIAVVHDMLHQEPDLFPASRTKRMLSRFTFQHIARHASAICFGSRFSHREFARRFKCRAPTQITSYGIDHRDWELFDPEYPPEKKTKLLVVAAAKKHKNFEIAIQAFLDADLPEHWALTVITPDDKLRSSIDLSSLSRPSEQIEFLQGVSNTKLRKIYGEAAILLMPSLYEGFGLPLAEGLQAGAACISSTAGSLVELGQGAQVTYVNGNDLAGWIQAIRAECGRFDAQQVPLQEIRHNMQHATLFSWKNVAEKTAEVISGVLSARNNH